MDSAIFESSNGHRLELSITGYQFPELTTEDYDSNWLLVRGMVTHPTGKWMFHDPCLLTYELSELCRWLQDVAEGNRDAGGIEFLEPNLRFRVDVRSLKVFFELEARPGWAPADGAGMDDLWLEFPIEELDLPVAARSLRDALQEYPQRAAF